MKYFSYKRLFLAFLFVLTGAGTYAAVPDGDQSASDKRGGRIARVKPVLIGNEQMNRTIIFVSENCELVIPPDRNIDDIEGRIFCSFTVDSSGCVSTVWITKGLNHWLDRAVSEAIMKLPAWNGYFGKSDKKSSTRHEVVFSFTSSSGLGFTDINTVAAERETAMKNELKEQKRKESKETKARNEKWTKFRNDNMVETITAEHRKALRGQDADVSLQDPSPSIGDLQRPGGKTAGITVSPAVDMD